MGNLDGEVTICFVWIKNLVAVVWSKFLILAVNVNYSRLMNNTKHPSEDAERPPIFGSWNGIYALVIGSLFILIVLFYLLTSYYA